MCIRDRSSGKGILFVLRKGLMKKEEEILSGMLHKQGYLMVERRLTRVLDLSLIHIYISCTDAVWLLVICRASSCEGVTMYEKVIPVMKSKYIRSIISLYW